MKAQKARDRAAVSTGWWKLDAAQVRLALWMLAATLFAYLPAINGRFVWDDDAHITRPALRSMGGLWKIWLEPGVTQQYYPLLHSAFWLEHGLWGNSAIGYHIVNIVLHAAAAFLLVLILRRLMLPGALLAGLIFALHPVCVEAVAWISEQKSTLSGAFYMGAALAYLSFDETRRRSRYVLALVLFVCALLSKTVTATLPAALLLVLWWKRGRLEWKRDIVPLIGWLPLGAAAGLFTAWVENTYVSHADAGYYALTFLQRVLLAGRAICFYAAKLIWPVNLTFTYPRWQIDPAQAWQFIFPTLVAVVGVAFLMLARKCRGPLAAFLYFVGTLFPVLGFLNVYPFRYSWVADHFQYLASLGVIVPAAAMLTVAVARLSLEKKHVTALAAVLVVTLGLLTWLQAGTYRNGVALYRETLARNPDSYMAHQNLGNILVQTPGHLQEAIGEFETALRIEPNNPEAHNSLGSALLQVRGRVPDALAEFQRALKARPNYAEAHNNLGSALMQTPGRAVEGFNEFQTAVRLKPDLAIAHENIGIVLASMPAHRNDAILELRTAVRLDPRDTSARRLLQKLLSEPARKSPTSRPSRRG